jgi:predicted small integral membrane protein
MLTLRLAKTACVAALALYAGVVAFGNVADYWTNFAFVTHVTVTCSMGMHLDLDRKKYHLFYRQSILKKRKDA